jgi:hypothetical protein
VQGQPASWPVSVTVPRAGSRPRLTGVRPVPVGTTTLAASSAPAGTSERTRTVTRIASPFSVTGGGAGGARAAASDGSGVAVRLWLQ